MPQKLNRLKRQQIQWPFEAELFIPEGLHGFKKEKYFRLTGRENEIPFLWLESCENPSLAFVVVDPYLAVPGFNLWVSEDDVKKLNIQKSDRLFLLSIVNFKEQPFTVNLTAPLLIDWGKKIATQLLTANTNLSH